MRKLRALLKTLFMSFNRELKREAEKIDLIAFKIEGNLAKADTSLKKADTLEKRITPIERSSQYYFAKQFPN